MNIVIKFYLTIILAGIFLSVSCKKSKSELVDKTDLNETDTIGKVEELKIAGLTGKEYEVTMWGNVSKDSITFHIYLPPGYYTSTVRYPVVYQLHGINGVLGGNQESTIPGSYEAAKVAGLYGDVIIVFPDGYLNTFWANSSNSDKPAETNLVKEIIPFVDVFYRTMPDRKHRIIQGFSMGGFGAAKFATKYPELFGSCIMYDAAMLDWNGIKQRHKELASEIFNNDSTIYNSYSPWAFTDKNAEFLKMNTCFRIVIGAIKEDNRKFLALLESLDISVESTETQCDHNLKCLIDAEGLNTARFISKYSK
jgi:enterochelin esterase-like enzyme